MQPLMRRRLPLLLQLLALTAAPVEPASFVRMSAAAAGSSPPPKPPPPPCSAGPPPAPPGRVKDVLVDLLDLAAKSLKRGGRLVYLLPTPYDFVDADLPRHPCLEPCANSEQPLTMKMGRRLITMEKRQEYIVANADAYRTAAAASCSAPCARLRQPDVKCPPSPCHRLSSLLP